MESKEKVDVFIEALSYIKKYHNKRVVIKFGGNAMSEVFKHLIEDIVFLKRIGIKPIVVHGGGSEIDAELKKLHIATKFINGLRCTDSQTIKVVERVFKKINAKIVSDIRKHGTKAVTADGCIRVKQKSQELGLVGEITGIDKDRLLGLINSSYVPVISSLGKGNDGKTYNINADTTASNIAISLKAEKLTILTDVDGVIIKGRLILHLDFKTAEKGIKEGIIKKGMIPKVEACIHAVKNKCQKAHLINGLVPHSLLLEIFTDKGIGTEIVYKNDSQK